MGYRPRFDKQQFVVRRQVVIRLDEARRPLDCQFVNLRGGLQAKRELPLIGGCETVSRHQLLRPELIRGAHGNGGANGIPRAADGPQVHNQ